MEGLISFFLSFQAFMALCFCLAPLLPLLGPVGLLVVISCQAGLLGLISFFLSFLSGFHGPLFLPCSTFASSWTCGLACCHLFMGWPIRPYFSLFIFKLLWPLHCLLVSFLHLSLLVVGLFYCWAFFLFFKYRKQVSTL